jgi:hypothetical protein
LGQRILQGRAIGGASLVRCQALWLTNPVMVKLAFWLCGGDKHHCNLAAEVVQEHRCSLLHIPRAVCRKMIARSRIYRLITTKPLLNGSTTHIAYPSLAPVDYRGRNVKIREFGSKPDNGNGAKSGIITPTGYSYAFTFYQKHLCPNH